MKNTQIIEKIAKERMVEEIVGNVAKTSDLTQRCLDDLCQDIYIQLLEKPPTLIEQLYENKQLKFYVARMAVNNIHSTLSPYFYNYIKPMQHAEIDTQINDQDT